MSGSVGAPLTIALRDGSVLRLTGETLAIGERELDVGRIQDARQVSPDPETVAVRVAGAGMFEFQPARPGDGALALEALYRLRPDLRPPGFEPLPVVLPPGFPPATARAAAGMPFAASALPAAGHPAFPATAGVAPGWPRTQPNTQPGARQRAPVTVDGRLTPYPRTSGAVLGAGFRVFGTRVGWWLLVGLCVSLVPAALSGGIWVALLLAIGINPWGDVTAGLTRWANAFSTPTVANGQLVLPALDARTLLTFGGVALGLLVLYIIFSAWQAATCAIGTREALLGRRPALGASLREGLRRLLPVFVASALVMLIEALALAALAVAFTISMGSLSAITPSSAGSASASALALVGCGAGVLALVLAVGVIFLWVRLSFAAYAAATQPLGPLAAIAASWRLTRRNWWRALFPLLAVGMLAALAANVASSVETTSFALGALVVVPLAAVVTEPLQAVVATTVLYDLRVRREGYAAVVAGEAAPLAGGHGPAQA